MSNSSQNILRCLSGIFRGVRAKCRSAWRGTRRSIFSPLVARLRESKTSRVGRWGERVALRLVKRSKLIPLHTNWLSKEGELDIIALEHRTLVAIEVKTRSLEHKHAYPALTAVNDDKRQRLTRLILRYRRSHSPFCRRYGIRAHRIDAVEVYYKRNWFGLLSVASTVWYKGICPRQNTQR